MGSTVGKKKKPRARKRSPSAAPGVAPRDSLARVVKEPPQVWVEGDAGTEAAYVRLPVSAEVVAAVREHADNAAALYSLVKRGERVPVAELLSLLSKAAAAVERDASKLRRRK